MSRCPYLAYKIGKSVRNVSEYARAGGGSALDWAIDEMGDVIEGPGLEDRFPLEKECGFTEKDMKGVRRDFNEIIEAYDIYEYDEVEKHAVLMEKHLDALFGKRKEMKESL